MELLTHRRQLFDYCINEQTGGGMIVNEASTSQGKHQGKSVKSSMDRSVQALGKVDLICGAKALSDGKQST